MALAKKPFVVIDAEILSSSVWSESAQVRLVWITLLILCDTDGYVGASLPGISTAAGVTLAEAEEAIQRLQAPDPYSRTKADEGRRLRVAERGWQILNFRQHLDRLSSERTKARDRMRRHRERKRAGVTPVTPVTNVTHRNAPKRKRNGDAMKRNSKESPVTVLAGSREQGVGSSEENGRTEERADERPPEDRVRGSNFRAASDLDVKILRACRVISEKTGEPAWKCMRQVTSYKRRDGEMSAGVEDPSRLGSVLAREKALADAEWWLADLEKKANGPSS